MTRKKWATPDDPRFAKTECVVDATHEESFNLWFRWAEFYRVPWEQDTRGWMGQIGTVDKRPIVASVFWNMVGPSRVAFVEMTSQLADYEMMEQWERAVFPCMSTFGRHANAANFGNILSDIERRHGIELGQLRERKQIDSFWQVDSELPHGTDEPQRAYEMAERKIVEWSQRAEYWRAKTLTGGTARG